MYFFCTKCGGKNLERKNTLEPIYASAGSGMPKDMIIDYVFQGEEIVCIDCKNKQPIESSVESERAE